MSNYATLRHKYLLAVDRNLRRTPILRKAAQGIIESLDLFLDLPIKSFTDLDGLEMPYLSLGRIEVDQFRPSQIENFVAGNDGLMFSIHIVLDEAADLFPKAYICFNFTVDETNGILTVTSHSAVGGPFIINGSDFSPVSEHIYNVVLAELGTFDWQPTAAGVDLGAEVGRCPVPGAVLTPVPEKMPLTGKTFLSKRAPATVSHAYNKSTDTRSTSDANE